jgi:hypothetical protein
MKTCLKLAAIVAGLAGGIPDHLEAQPLLPTAQVAGDAGTPPPALREPLTRDLEQRLATHDRAGRWRSADSSLLAWSCGQELSAQVDLFQATGERKWLDQLVRHADAMFAHLTPNRDGFLSWRSRSYSSFRILVRRAEGDRSQAVVEPAEQWLRQAQPWTRELLRPALTGQALVVDWEYHLTWREGAQVEVRGATTDKVLSTVTVRAGEPFTALPGVTLTWRGAPVAGDRFTLSVQQPKDFDHAVHDGVILTPICRFIALVRTDPGLREAYGRQAEGYLKVIRSDLIPKWKPYWRDCGDGGLLVAPTDEALTYPGISLPHNQYLALGNALIWLDRITGDRAYRDQVTRMARFFKSHLRLVEDRYEWNYWDAAGAWDRPWDKPEEKRAEDTGHGSLDISFVVDAAEAGIVFDRTDLQRLANTFLRKMWNGSLTKPTVGGYVNTAKPTRQSGNLQDWVRLSRQAPQVLAVCARVIPQTGSVKAKAQLLRLLTEAARGTHR